MSNRIKIHGNVRRRQDPKHPNGRSREPGPQIGKVPTPWHSRDKSPTYSEALSALRRADKAEAKARGVPYNRHFKKVLKKERIKRALQKQASGG